MKEQTRGKRLLSILLCFVMMLSLVPMTAFATSTPAVTGAYVGHSETDAVLMTSTTDTFGVASVRMPAYFNGDSVYVKLKASIDDVEWLLAITKLTELGLSFNSSTGVISGTLNLTDAEVGWSTIQAKNKSTNEMVQFNLYHKLFMPDDIPVIKDDVTPPVGNIDSNYYWSGLTYDGYKTLGDSKWNITSGKLPNGLNISSHQSGHLCISGTPTESGTFNFGVNVTTSAGTSAEKNIALTINANSAESRPKITNAGSLPYAVEGKLYEYQFSAIGASPISWEKQGNWPTWLNLDENTGKIYGTPPVGTNNVSLGIKAKHTPAGGATLEDTESFNFNVAAQPSVIVEQGQYDFTTINGSALPDGQVGEKYLGYDCIRIKNKDNFGAIDIQITGNLPAGMSSSQVAGLVQIDGTPTQAGTYYFRVTINKYYDTAKTQLIGTATRDLSLTITGNGGATPHSHSWATTWTTNGTHHWHECTATGCNITDNSQKSGYGTHSGGTANCCNKAVCSTCNVEYGEKNPVIHANSNATTKYDDDYHWNERNCCGELIGTRQAHTYDNDTDTTCNDCGYTRSLTHTCGSTTLTAVDKVEATHFTEGKQAYYECSCGEYYEDATAATKITDISIWGVINKTSHQLSGWKHDDANTKHWKECTISGCTHKEQEATHLGGTATCQEKKTCTECGEKYGEFGAHNYDITTWGYKGADGHAHYCKTTGCTEHDTITAHIPGAAATEEAAQTCTVCGYELAAKLEHAPMLVEGYEATTEAPGKKDYYHCDSCGRNYEDPTSLKEITGDVEEWRYIPMIIAIIEGNGQVWTKGTNADLTFKSNANFADFTRVEVDGAKVDASNYTKSEGSTIVTLKASFLETLSVGEHTIVIVSANDVPEAKFTVKAAATGGNTGNEQNPDTGVTSPQTGDSSNMFLWIVLLFVSLGGLTTTVVYKKRKAVKE